MQARLLVSTAAAFALMVALLISRPSAQTNRTDWPRWRGAESTGSVSTGRHIFTGPFTLKKRWTRTLGPGYSGVVVAEGRAVTMFSDGKNDVLISLASATGAEQWRVPVGVTYPGRDGSAGGPVSTPAIADGAVFAIGPRGDVVAVSAMRGQRLWSRQLVKEFGAAEPHWGFTTSPLVAGNRVIVVAGGGASNAVIALDARTGATAWTAGTDTASYQSAMLMKLGDSDAVIAAGDRFLFALNPRDGRELWRYEHRGTGFYGRIINPVALPGGGLLLTSNPDQATLLTARGGAKPTVAWTTRELKLNYSTPVVHNGMVFGYSGAFLTAIDAGTGTIKWRSRPPGDGFAIVVDDHLVVLTKDGHLTVAPADGTAFTPKAAVEVFSQFVWTPPSFAEGRIYARDSYSDVAAIDVVAARDTTAPAAAAPVRGRVPSSAFARWVAETERAPDADDRVRRFLAEHPSLPVIEGDRTAHILYTLYTGDGDSVVLRSDALGTGVDWPLNRVGRTDLYYVSLELEPDARISYQFVRTLGETAPDARNPLKASSQNFAGEVSLLLMPRADRALPAAAALTGRLVDLSFDSGAASAAHLQWGGRRKVHVYLPPGYDTDAARRFPAIYVMYGEEMLSDGHLAAALDRAMAVSVRPAVIVFVESTSAYEYARSFRDPHARMFAERLVPWIDGQFRTSAAAPDRLLIGADEAGFAAVEIALRYPAVFGSAVAQSLFPLSAGGDELLGLIDAAPRTAQRFYIDWGRYDPRRTADRLDVAGFSRHVSARLAARGFEVHGGPTNDGSTLPYWAARAVHALERLWPAAAAR